MYGYLSSIGSKTHVGIGQPWAAWLVAANAGALQSGALPSLDFSGIEKSIPAAGVRFGAILLTIAAYLLLVAKL